MGDDLVPRGLKPDVVYEVEAIEPPTGHGVILTLLRRLPANGTWEVAYGGAWGHEWKLHMYEDFEVPELDADGLVPDDFEAACASCGHDDIRDDRTRIVFARPAHPAPTAPSLPAGSPT